MRPGTRFGLSVIEKREVWSRWKQGQSLHAIGRAFDKPHSCIRAVLLPRAAFLLLLVTAHDEHSHWLSGKTSREELLRGRRFVRSPAAWIERLRQ